MTTPEVTDADVAAFCRGLADRVANNQPKVTNWEGQLAYRCEQLHGLAAPPTRRHPASLRLHGLVAAGIAAALAARAKEGPHP